MEYNSSGAIHWSINKQFMVILIADIKNMRSTSRKEVQIAERKILAFLRLTEGHQLVAFVTCNFHRLLGTRK